MQASERAKERARPYIEDAKEATDRAIEAAKPALNKAKEYGRKFYDQAREGLKGLMDSSLTRRSRQSPIPKSLGTSRSNDALSFLC